jgi:ligand-binding sensor domain-containing protein/DNA-binding CsgD family transcriptional regulator
MKRLIILFFLIQSIVSQAQINTLGNPFIYNYSRSVYEAGTQNWGIAQDENGFMYFANNEGVLIFDGLRWNRIQFSQSKPIRSVLIDSKNIVYIGLLNDFGIIQQKGNSIGSFKSLRHLLPSDIEDFDDIWKIYELPQGIAFQTYEYIFILSGDSIKTIQPKNKFHFSYKTNSRYFFHEPDIGVYEFINGLIVETPFSNKMKDKEIVEILELENRFLLICTKNSGIFKYEDKKLEKWNTPISSFLEKEKLFCVIPISGNHFAFGTILNGIAITDSKGVILKQINKNNGLQNNTVLSLFSDKEDNLWLGLDNGIDYLEINSPISYITDSEGIGAGYCAKIFNNQLYLGTNQGLFVQSLDHDKNSHNKFELVSNTAGQVWSLNIFDNQLVCSHNAGTFHINGKVGKKISNENGAWRYIPFLNHPELIIGGHYNGLVLLKNTKNGWQFDKKIKGFNESCRFLEQSKNGDLWVSHGARGIYRIQLNESKDSVSEFKLYNAHHGLPSTDRNIVFSLNKEVFISTINGIYTFNSESDSFEYSEKFNKIFDVKGRLKTFVQSAEGNLWFIAQEEAGVLRLNKDNSYSKITAPFKKLDGRYVNEFESIYPYNNEHVFIGIDNGFAHFSSAQPRVYNDSYNTYIIQVTLPYLDSSLYFNKLRQTSNSYSFPYKKNSIRFYFTSPFYENLQQLEFSFYLENFSEEWSEWSKASFKDYTNLSAGEYSFHVKAKNIYELESNEAVFHFSIKPPYYKTKLAYYIYIILFLMLIVGIAFIIQIQLKKSKKRAEIKHKLELKKREDEFKHQALIAEKEIIRLRNDKLRSEMLYKDKELANQTMNIIQKNKFLIKLKEELSILQNSTNDPQQSNLLQAISQRLEKEIDNKRQNKVFKTYFEEVHETFFSRLKEKYSKLSPRDLHLCAYIKMNLSTKEISSLLNISSRGVEISRYRLRKKINLSRDVNLSTHLNNI